MRVVMRFFGSYFGVGLLLISAWIFSACDPVDQLRAVIVGYGYIYYETPLAQAGPGTLVGGGPKNLQLVANPETCFPHQINGVSTGLYFVDDSSLPERSHQVSAKGSAAVSLVNFMGSGNPLLGVGASFSEVQSVSLKMDGIHIEYIDSIRLAQFYHESLSPACKDF